MGWGFFFSPLIFLKKNPRVRCRVFIEAQIMERSGHAKQGSRLGQAEQSVSPAPGDEASTTR